MDILLIPIFGILMVSYICAQIVIAKNSGTWDQNRIIKHLEKKYREVEILEISHKPDIEDGAVGPDVSDLFGRRYRVSFNVKGNNKVRFFRTAFLRGVKDDGTKESVPIELSN